MPVPLRGTVELPVGKENDVSAKLGEPVPLGLPVELPVAKEKDVTPPVPGAVPVPVCWEGTPVSEPEPGADPVKPPVGAPEMPVSDPVPDGALPGPPDTDSAGMPVDSWYMESASVGFCGGLVSLVQFSAVLFPVGKLNEISSPLPGSYSVPEGPGISSVE